MVFIKMGRKYYSKMKTIRTKYIPVQGFKAIMLFGVVFYRGKNLTQKQFNHEFYHMMQWRDVTLISAVPIVFISAIFNWWLLIAIPFVYYIIYLLEWFIKLILSGNAMKAYKDVSFERDAREFEHIIFGDCTAEKQWSSFGWVKRIRLKSLKK